MMIFSMYITGNCTAYCNEFRAGRDRKKPPGRDNHFQDLIERNTALTFKNTSLFIEGKYLVEFQCGNGIFSQ